MSTTSNLTTAQRCSGTPTVSVSDNRGLSVRTLQYNRNAVGEAANELIAQQRYSVNGQLLSSIDPRLFAAQQADPAVLPNFRYHHSLSGQVLLARSQDAGQQITLHDIEAGPVWQGNSRGHLMRFAYDGLHRLSSVHEKDGAQPSERVSERYLYGEDQANAINANSRGQLVRHYDTAGLNEVGGYTVNGQPLRMVRQLLRDDSAHSDWQGAENQWPVVLESERHQSRIGYNALGEVLNSVDAKGNQQRQQLDIAGQLASSGLTLVGQAVERPILTSISYSAGGQVLREAASNGVVTDYRYEPQTLRLSRLISTRPSPAGRNSLLLDLSYVYDPVGNILSISDAAIDSRYHNNQQIEPANDYQYDALYQLLTASGRENVGASRQGPGLPTASSSDPNQYSNYTRQYRYDHGGNLTQVRHVGNRNYTLDMLVSKTSNRAAQQTEFLTQDDVEEQFDAAGNLKQLVVGQPMTWDGRNQLQSVTQVLRSDSDDDEEHYQYDGAGTRVRKTTVSHTSSTTRRAQVIYLPGLELRRTESTLGNTTRLEEALQVISVGSAGRQQVRVLHWEEGKPDDIANDQLRASLDNQIGSSLLELDQNADILTQEEYYPFGGTAVWSGKNASETKYKFVRYSGKERDATGLYYYGFRYYAPWLGRWLNPDPAGTVDGLNLYRMVRNNPVNLKDENGLAPGDQASSVENGSMTPNLATPLGEHFYLFQSNPGTPGSKLFITAHGEQALLMHFNVPEATKLVYYGPHGKSLINADLGDAIKGVIATYKVKEPASRVHDYMISKFSSDDYESIAGHLEDGVDVLSVRSRRTPGLIFKNVFMRLSNVFDELAKNNIRYDEVHCLMCRETSLNPFSGEYQPPPSTSEPTVSTRSLSATPGQRVDFDFDVDIFDRLDQVSNMFQTVRRRSTEEMAES